MRPTHETALAATARISCATMVWLAACERPAAAPVSEPAPSDPVVVAEPDPYASDPSLDPSLNTPPLSEARREVETCQSQVDAALARGPLDDEHARCCRVLATNLFQPVDDPASDQATRDARQAADAEQWWAASSSCCALIGSREGACTPWGPPTPPTRLAAHSDAPPAWLDLRELAKRERPRIDVPRDPSVRAAAIATWRARMINEHGSARVFEGLVTQLDALRMLDARSLARASRFAAQERRHGVLCGAVVEALGGAAEGPASPALPFPTHADASSSLEACLRNLVSICCLSETVAVALIAAEREDMPAGPLRELLTSIWAEECGHANFGWRVLPRLLAQADAATRAGLDAYLSLAFAELETHELAHLPLRAAPPQGARLGLCDGRDARALFYATVERVIVPALAAQGLAAARAWAQRDQARVTATARS
jgi:hypothetical protein